MARNFVVAWLLAAVTGAGVLAPVSGAMAQDAPPLVIEIDEGVIEPMPFAAPVFIAEDAGAAEFAAQLTDVMTNDLTGTALFRLIDRNAYISSPSSFEATPQFADWRAINSQALVTGAVSTSGNQITLRFRLWDVYAGQPVGQGLQLVGDRDNWRRLAHKVADQVYTRITGEDPYFDSRVVFVAESGPKNARVKRLAIMDQDGANLRYLTDGSSMVLTPRFNPTSQEVIYMSYQTGEPRVFLMNVDTLQREELERQPGMTFAPRFSPDGSSVVMSLSRGGNTDIYSVPLGSRQLIQLTNSPAIDTAPSYSPDGSQIVFESDRGGKQQLYVMSAGGGGARRISFGDGAYATPVWSPRGDMIAFTKQQGGRFYIGVMRPDGSDEKLLTASFLDEGPTWSPNGRVLMFFRESPGPNGAPALRSVDVTGRNERRVPLNMPASDPAWSPLLQ
ncbi:Tol-Pal system beta propeller repeat protein TolB [Oceanicella sp. SM1341]|uniref:Tol-Pal system beta propeller repeat protein TolB n=1 Tax=Oceanicella sp. SM1341 TaxID=1548889 RepID=UPI000E4FF1EF